jgi:shikimate dehydrogenase
MLASRMGFVGVDTRHSSIMKVFPLWADALGLPSRELRSFDLSLDATSEQYRAVVSVIRDDPKQAGALVTTHKMRVYEAAHDLFDSFDRFALACGEVSSISKDDGQLLGHAKDPITVGLALDAIIPETYFATTGASVVCLGSGGSGTALTWHLAHRADRPERVVITALRQSRLDHTRKIHERGGLNTDQFEYRLLDTQSPAEDADHIVTKAGEYALIVNATGMGKDRPGSPLTGSVVFPRHAIAWEFNYRGALEFLHQAEAAQSRRELTVVDGWEYFIHGWSQVIAEVFHIPMPPERVAELSRIASTVR